MSDPYDNDGEQDEGTANAALLAEMRAAESDDDGETVTIGDPVGNEDDGEEDRPNRRARRAQRGNDYKRRRDEEAASAQEETQRLREELAEMRGRMDGMQQQSQGPQSDQFDDAVKEEQGKRAQTLRDYKAAIAQSIAAKKDMTPDEEASWLARNDAHSAALTRIEVQRATAASNSPQNQAQARLQAMYPDVMTNDNARNYAVATYQAKRASGEIRDGDDQEAVDDIMKQTRGVFRLGDRRNSPPATERQNASYGRQGGTGRSGGKSSKTFTYTEDTKQMALSYMKHRKDLTDDQKLQAYANEVGNG